jgi:hypothetical protein
MLNPKYQRFADRFRELIEEGQALTQLPLEYGEMAGYYLSDQHDTRLLSWFSRTVNIVERVFGAQSYAFKRLKEEELRLECVDSISRIVGLLVGGLDDLEKGFLLGQEFLVAAEVFDSILMQAVYLNQAGYKDPAAVLARVVIEDALRRIARQEGIDDTRKASKLNDDLRKAGRYSQPQWRLIQSWLDIGNAAAHGEFDAYDQDAVKRLLEDVERFLATELRA